MLVDYKQVAQTLRKCVETYKEWSGEHITHFGHAIALCDREAEAVGSTPPVDLEHVYCQDLLARLLQANAEEAMNLLVDARVSARAVGREEGIAAMRDSHKAAHERYAQAIADLQTKHDLLAVELQQLRVSEPPTSIFRVPRRWLGCSNPAHEHAGDESCPDCVWQQS